MAAIELDDTNFSESVGASEMAIVDFHAGWCGPCIMFKPKFKRISNDYPHVSFFLVNGEKSPEARKTVQIDNLPYFAVYKNGELVEGRSMATEEAFRAYLDEQFGAPK